mgnify:CR=1 FL=1
MLDIENKGRRAFMSSVAMAALYVRLPTSFLPNEDQGSLSMNFQLPVGSTSEQTRATAMEVTRYILDTEADNVLAVFVIMGRGQAGTAQNAGQGFILLKDWSERTAPGSDAQSLAGRAFGALSGIRDAFIFALSPPPIPELGSSSGFSFRLQDRAGLGRDALVAARNQLLGMASQSKLLAGVRPDGLEDAPQLRIDIDRGAAKRLPIGE